MPDIEADAVAEQHHLHRRHQQGDGQAARVAPDLQRFLIGDGEEPAQLHDAAWRRETSRTNTSSRLGAIGSGAVAVMFWARSNAGRASGVLSVAQQHVQAVAENRRLDHARHLAQRGQSRAQRCGLQFEQRAAQMPAAQRPGAAHRHQPPGIDQRDAVAIFRLVHVVRGDQDRHAIRRERMDQVPEAPSGLRLHA